MFFQMSSKNDFHTYKYCNTSFQYSNRGISPVSWLRARSLEANVIIQKSFICLELARLYNLTEHIISEREDSQCFKIRKLGEGGRNRTSQLIVFQIPEIIGLR